MLMDAPATAHGENQTTILNMHGAEITGVRGLELYGNPSQPPYQQAPMVRLVQRSHSQYRCKCQVAGFAYDINLNESKEVEVRVRHGTSLPIRSSTQMRLRSYVQNAVSVLEVLCRVTHALPLTHSNLIRSSTQMSLRSYMQNAVSVLEVLLVSCRTHTSFDSFKFMSPASQTK